MYPEKAIRELVANALIHQDFTVTGAGPMVEIFTDRMEITNPGEPLVDTLRFIDTPPRSRNEDLAALMRRMKICEEGGTGIDKVIEAVEAVPASGPRLRGHHDHAAGVHEGDPVRLPEARRHGLEGPYPGLLPARLPVLRDRGQRMTNASLRQRFGIESDNAAQASRLIKEALAAKVIRLFDAKTRLRDRSYVPFWA